MDDGSQFEVYSEAQCNILFKHAKDCLSRNESDPIALATEWKEICVQVEAERLESILCFLEVNNRISDVEKIEFFKKVNQPYTSAPDWFAIKVSCPMEVMTQERTCKIFNLSPHIIEVNHKEEQGIINQLLGSSYWTLIDHFSLGHSPTKVYLARCFEERELHVLKIGRAPVIQAECDRFQRSEYWRTLPKTAQLKSWFIPFDKSLGGLNYELAGGYVDMVETLGQHFSKKIISLEGGQVQAKEVNPHFKNVINRALQGAWLAWDHRLAKRFSPVHTFDRLLPVNLELRVPPNKPRKCIVCPIDGTLELSDYSWLPLGSPVTLYNFVIEEIR